MSRASLVAVLTLSLVSGCGSPRAAAPAPREPGGNLTVLAAASLSEAFTRVARGFESEHPGVRVSTSFGASSSLAAQLEAGSEADVMASADQASMDRVSRAGLLADPPVVFAHNRLQIAVGPGNPRRIAGLADLARPGLLVALCQPAVPCGRYAAQALSKAGVTVTPASQEVDVKSVLGRVELGEADAGIVYVTDVSAAGPRVSAVTIPDTQNVVADYPIAPLKGRRQELARRFIAYILGARGRAVLGAQGFS